MRTFKPVVYISGLSWSRQWKLIMNCLALKLLHTNGVLCKYYSLIIIFVFGVLSSVILNIFWTYVSYNENQPKQLIIRRQFSIIDFDDHDFNTDQNAHELIIRETEVDVVCKYK